jgi:hypothetical protein
MIMLPRRTTAERELHEMNQSHSRTVAKHRPEHEHISIRATDRHAGARAALNRQTLLQNTGSGNHFTFATHQRTASHRSPLETLPVPQRHLPSSCPVTVNRLGTANTPATYSGSTEF